MSFDELTYIGLYKQEKPRDRQQRVQLRPETEQRAQFVNFKYIGLLLFSIFFNLNKSKRRS